MRPRTRMDRNPYEPPRTDGQVAAAPAAATRFPFDLILRALLGVVLCLLGAYALVWLHRHWDQLADRAVIQPSWNPWFILVPIVALALSGVAMLLRSRFTLVTFGLYCVANDILAWHMAGWPLPRVIVLTVALQLLVLAFIVRLLSRNLLR